MDLWSPVSGQLVESLDNDARRDENPEFSTHGLRSHRLLEQSLQGPHVIVS